MPGTVAAVYDNISLAVLHLSAELGPGFEITPHADGSVSVQFHARRGSLIAGWGLSDAASSQPELFDFR